MPRRLPLRLPTRRRTKLAPTSNVAIYAIDPRGLPTGKRTTIEPVLLPDEDVFSREAFRSKRLLRLLSAETGGTSLTNSNDFDGVFERAVSDSSQYYLLGIEPPASADRGVQRIDVRVRRPGLRVRTRRSYVAMPPSGTTGPALSPSARLEALLRRPLPQSGLTMRVSATALRADSGSQVVVTVEMTDSGTTSRKADEQLSLLLAAVGKNGKVKASRSVATSVPAGPGRTIRLVSQLQLRAGEYQLRVAAVASRGGQQGSVHYDLRVPDWSTRPVALSAPMFSSVRTREVPTARWPAALAARLDMVPTSDRVFGRGDVLSVDTRVYRTDRRVKEPVEARAQLADAKSGRVVFAREETIPPGGDSGGSTERGNEVRRFEATVALASIEPGDYVMSVQASVPGRGTPVTHRVPIRVVDAASPSD